MSTSAAPTDRPKVTLQSSDNQTFSVDKDVAIRSVLIKNMLQDLKESNDPIPLLNVNKEVLEKVIEYCTHHRNDELPPDDTDPSDEEHRKRVTEISEWDQKFIQVDQEMLFEIILAANYLDIKPLLDVGCKTVADMIKGKTPEEIRTLFNIVNDFTPEEEEQIRRENEWAYDGDAVDQPSHHTPSSTLEPVQLTKTRGSIWSPFRRFLAMCHRIMRQAGLFLQQKRKRSSKPVDDLERKIATSESFVVKDNEPVTHGDGGVDLKEFERCDSISLNEN